MVVSTLSHYQFWHGKDGNSYIDVICMLPNGICVSFESLRADTPVSQIKSTLWVEAERYSMSGMLMAPSEYIFRVVSLSAGTEEIMDEELSLYDIKPARPYLKVIKRQGDEQRNRIDAKISMLIGKAVTSSKDEQVLELREKCLQFCNNISQQRGRASWERRAIYTYPPDFEESTELPEALHEKLLLTDGMLKITVSYVVDSTRMKNGFNMSHQLKPRDLVERVLQKRVSTVLGKQNKFVENPDDFVLKEMGRDNFFLGFLRNEGEGNDKYMEKPLIQYKYIRECVLWSRDIKLILKEKHELDVVVIEQPTSIAQPPPLPDRKNNNEICLWDLNRATMFRVKVQCVLNIMSTAEMWKEVQCGVFHGGEEVCETRKTSRQKGVHPVWNEFLEFELPVADIPRMARLCFCIVGYNKNKKSQPIPIAWVNFPIFNYKGTLNMGTQKLACKQHIDNNKVKRQTPVFFNPLGTVSTAGNDNKGTCIVMEFMNFAHSVSYPNDHLIYDMALRNPRRPAFEYNGKGWDYYKDTIEQIIERDTLAPMFEEDKELLWAWRENCCKYYPESLPKLLQCVKWNKHDEVIEINYLLKVWNHKQLEMEIALELLDYKFPDNNVRSLAIKVLDAISDSQLEMYFLHLVQALKYESYLENPLAKYLLRRALNNRRIGHYLFWHLKAEVANPDNALMFGLILEMYCRGALQHIDILLKQVEAINKLKTVTELLKSYPNNDEPKKLEMMKDCFKGSSYDKTFTDLVSPLDPRYRLKKLKVDKCKYMDSKKKPLWLVFENSDEGADDVLIIFKNGDDLRQDSLTLLSLRLMENVWRNSGLDYGVIPYRVLPTGFMVGLIEVVPKAETLGRIQEGHGVFTGVFRETALYSTLEKYKSKEQQNDRNIDIKSYIENFTNSVIGYNVSMYVLGVGDRHNDNIMLKQDTGQLFHIDFGHFLGNYKTKWGYNREKAKLILTKDIQYVINRSDDEKSFERFKEMCVEAFSCLRKKGNLFITVFAMLLSSGIPELNHPDDLEYLRSSLAMSKNEADAEKHFQGVFDDAIRHNSHTSLMFWVHNVKHRWII